MNHTTLIIDNNIEFSKKLKEQLQTVLNSEVDVINDYRELSKDEMNKYQLYIIRFDPKTEQLIKIVSFEDKTILLTIDKDSKESRDKILAFGIADYIVTDTIQSHKQVTCVANRLNRNRTVNVLVVDDSKLVLTHISMLLESQNLNFILASDGQEALDYINDSTSTKIDLIITDYEMPKMNGYELIKNIRERYSIEELPILVLSGTEDTYMITRFLKVGANDYIPKPFINEEFIGRINNTLSLLDMFNKIKNMAMTDYLTGIHNRVYFFEVGAKIFDVSKRLGHPLAIAMIDIDNFKSVNDTYGHEIGDKALIHVANTIKKSLRRSDILVRFGGEEFVIMLPNCKEEMAEKIMSNVCKRVAQAQLNIGDNKSINITVSIGVTPNITSLDEMIEKADSAMYIAKKSGKNKVVKAD